MRRLLQTTFASAILALILALTFSTSQAQNNPNNQNSTMQKGEMLLGKVINAQTGEPVVHAKVAVTVGGNYNLTVTTNRDGLFIATGVSQGDHHIEVRAAGYQLWQNTVYVPALNKRNAAGPFNGFFMPSENENGWFHGVFQTSNSDNNPSNPFAKSLFVVIGLQMK